MLVTWLFHSFCQIAGQQRGIMQLTVESFLSDLVLKQGKIQKMFSIYLCAINFKILIFDNYLVVEYRI